MLRHTPVDRSGLFPNSFLPLALFVILIAGCRRSTEETGGEAGPVEGTFAYDVAFLSKYQDVVVLSDADSQAQVLLCAAYQGRVMTSTAQGDAGRSFGWINHELIATGVKQQKINAYGGEDRFWLGPEGGQYSIFFEPGDRFVFDDWATPAAIDSRPFDLVSSGADRAVFTANMTLENYSGHVLSLRVDRTVRLYAPSELDSMLGGWDEDASAVGYASVNAITNTGSEQWTPQRGALSIWILGMFNPSPGTTIVLPYRNGDSAARERVVQDAYFGEVPEERLQTGRRAVYFSGDGRYRSKIGIGPAHALPWAGSYDEQSNVLTLIMFTFDPSNTRYVNSMWELQDDPYGGDVVNAYNDGPVGGGPPLGPFYELESSSPAAFLEPGGSMQHTHSTFHIVGDEQVLDAIARDKLGVGLQTIKKVFQ